MKKKSRATVGAPGSGFRGSKLPQNIMTDNPNGLKREIDPSMTKQIEEFKQRNPSK